MNAKHTSNSRPGHRLLALAIAGICACSNIQAAPTGAVVSHGDASFSSQGNTLTITNSPGTIINWQQFSIAPNEVTRFVQQGNHSSVLNRVIGSGTSIIQGTLLSNGQVYLLNPNGIVFGPGARVDVAGLIASSLQLSNQDFLDGRLNFNPSPEAGAIYNQGSLTTPAGGRIYLIAPKVENTGLINAPNGDILLAAGHQVSLVDSSNPDLQVVINAPENAVVNLGQIIAAGGRIGIHAALLQQSGRISADSAVQGEGGRIFLKATSNARLEVGSETTARGDEGGQVRVDAAGDTVLAGRVDVSASQRSGGQVQLLGNRVAVEAGGSVDASGPLGGGQILVGGDYRGENPAIRNASQTRLDSGARLTADATLQGDGGKVIVWGNETTQAHGEISARGGLQGGNGGFVETSAKYLYTQGARVDTRAQTGKTGMWLLDPIDVVIANTAGDPLGSFSGSTWATTSTAASSIISTADLQTQLGLSSVTIDSSAGAPSGTATTGSITVQDPLSWSSGHSLTLASTGDIYINANISGGTGALTAQAGGNIAIDDVLINAAQISFTTGASLTLTTLSQVTATGSASITSNGGMFLPGTIDPAIFSPTPGPGKLSAPQLNLYTSGDIQLNTATINYSGGNLLLDAAGSIILAQGSISATNLTLDAGQVIDQNATGSIVTPNLSATAGGSSDIGIDLRSASNSIGTFSGSVSQSNILLTSNGNLTLNGLSTQGGEVWIDSTGNLINQPPGIDACGSSTTCTSYVKLTSTSGSITTALIKAGSTVELNAGSNIIDGDGSANNIVSGGMGPVTLQYMAVGSVDLDAWGASISISGSASTANIRTTASPPPPPPPPAPTLDQCVATPALADCTTVLPTLATCTNTPTTAGCSAVLPSLDSCTATPTLTGCTVVLPSLDTCTSAPTTAGCGVVLPRVC